MIVTLKRHLVYKKVTKIYIYVVTKNHGICKILIVRLIYKTWSYDTVYIFFFRKSKQKFKTIFDIVESQTCQVI